MKLKVVRIRLKRTGTHKRPYYRIVAVDSRKKRDGKVLEEIGHYDPKAEKEKITLNSERYTYWLKCGAKPSEAIDSLLKKYKISRLPSEQSAIKKPAQTGEDVKNERTTTTNC
ncbi:MAG: 30S ribosomal protein S16 [Elusimicrobiota bacterium]|nr:30S ribosomal protein S16 [Elusimicrobiota bacterium]